MLSQKREKEFAGDWWCGRNRMPTESSFHVVSWRQCIPKADHCYGSVIWGPESISPVVCKSTLRLCGPRVPEPQDKSGRNLSCRSFPYIPQYVSPMRCESLQSLRNDRRLSVETR